MFGRSPARCFFAAIFFLVSLAGAQESDAPIHVTMRVNADGTRTSVQTDLARRESIATTTTAKGKTLKKIIYRLDEQGRYESGQVFSASGKLQLKTAYRYDEQGRLAEEAQLGKNGDVLHRIVYSFDPEGHPNGYSIYDGAGVLLGRTTPKVAASPARSR